MGFIESMGLFKQHVDVDSGKKKSRELRGDRDKMSRGTRNAGRTVALVALVALASCGDTWRQLGKCCS